MTTTSTDTLADLWYTRCPVPTASGLAFSQGWLGERAQALGLTLGVLQDAPAHIARHHYDHALPGLVREGGNVPAIVARANGAPTWLIGLTWIDERQLIVSRADEPVTAATLAGRRIAVPGWAAERHASHQRAMALAGFESVLRHAGLGLDAVQVVDVPVGATVPPGKLRAGRPGTGWMALAAVAEGRADAAYVKGSGGLAAARAAGLVAAIEIDALPERRLRVNNGTPRPLTVHDELLQHRPEWAVAFLQESLRAARWAREHTADVRAILEREAGGDAAEVREAYRDGFHAGFAPDLDADRLALLQVQADFLHRHGFTGHALRVDEWVAAGPLAQALRDDSGTPLRTP
ncbi:MAG: ABC transporter substrate-binding protein [Burkholderiaceae bacterium]|nr:ABC transporter substrate-binding protein [Burkholderiaceae bacterium]